ncbi:unnamed protein product [Rhizophagus irregularis]|nr:unnamed protein product [Rhizophagus irregularis]
MNEIMLHTPEILRSKEYTKAADIYSFGIIICLDSDPLKRPKAEEIENILYTWLSKPSDKQTTVLRAQIEEADNINSNSQNIIIPSTNLGLSYESRLLNFNNLPEPKNSDDYYEQNDNIISKEFSESLEHCRI